MTYQNLSTTNCFEPLKMILKLLVFYNLQVINLTLTLIIVNIKLRVWSDIQRLIIFCMWTLLVSIQCTVLMRPNEAETAVHGCWFTGDIYIKLHICFITYFISSYLVSSMSWNPPVDRSHYTSHLLKNKKVQRRRWLVTAVMSTWLILMASVCYIRPSCRAMNFLQHF